MGDLDVFQTGVSGAHEREGFHVPEPETVRAVRTLLSLTATGETKNILVSIHGYPRKGSKGDKKFSPGDHRVYSKYIGLRTLEEYVRRHRGSDILNFANDMFKEWGWSSVDGLTFAVVEQQSEA